MRFGLEHNAQIILLNSEIMVVMCLYKNVLLHLNNYCYNPIIRLFIVRNLKGYLLYKIM